MCCLINSNEKHDGQHNDVSHWAHPYPNWVAINRNFVWRSIRSHHQWGNVLPSVLHPPPKTNYPQIEYSAPKASTTPQHCSSLLSWAVQLSCKFITFNRDMQQAHSKQKATLSRQAFIAAYLFFPRCTEIKKSQFFSDAASPPQVMWQELTNQLHKTCFALSVQGRHNIWLKGLPTLVVTHH